MSIRGHFDGKVVVLDEPAALRANDRVLVLPDPNTSESDFGTLRYLLTHLAPISDDDAREMTEAIEQAFGHVEPERDVEL